MAALFDTTSASSMVAQPLQLNALLDHLRTYDVSFLVSASLLKVCVFVRMCSIDCCVDGADSWF
jgi:hypothetical protein